MRRSLGRGLQSLIPEARIDENSNDKTLGKQIKTSSEEDGGDRVIKVSLLDIKPRENQPRKNFNQESLEDLAKSIKEYGLLNPISLLKVDNHYNILAGERRFRACKLLGFKTIDALVKDYEDRDIEVLSLIENVQREDLSAIEEALAYKNLIDNYAMTQDEVATKLGKSRSYIANTIRLLKLSEKEKNALINGEISSSQARSLLSVKDDKQRGQVLEDYKNKKTVVREVEKLSRNAKEEVSNNKDKKSQIPNLDQLLFDDFEEKFMNKLSTKVRIDKEKDSYKIIIDCFSIDDIESIYERISYDN